MGRITRARQTWVGSDPGDTTPASTGCGVDWLRTTTASAPITTAIATACAAVTVSPSTIQASNAENTGINSVNVEPTHSGMRTSDQFIMAWPIRPELTAIRISQPQFVADGHDMSWPKTNPSGAQIAMVHSAVPAVNSVEVIVFFEFFEAMK